MPKNEDLFPRADLQICHPEYARGFIYTGESYLKNDLCLLRVDHDIQFGAYIQKA